MNKDKSRRNFKRVLILFLILILAYILRIYKNTEYPTGFFTDEAAIGYSSYKIFTTGKDDHNVPWPVFFQSLGDYRTPIPIYSNIPAIMLFGLSEFSVRFTTAMYGVGTVFLLYFIGKKLTNTRAGLLSSFLLAISPWHIHLSRWGAEYASFPFFIAVGFLLLIIAKSRPKMLVFSFLIFGLSLYTYYPAWVVTPLFVGAITVYWILNKGLRGILNLLASLSIFVITAVPLLIGIRSGYALTRLNNILPKNLTFQQEVDKFYHFYLDHFGKEFLFTKGDIGFPGHFITRQSVRGMGELYQYEGVFIILGLMAACYCIYKKQYFWILVIILLLLYPLGTALTMEGPFATRSVIGLIPFMLLSALGIAIFTKFTIKFKISFLFAITLSLIVSLNISSYLFKYYKEYPLYSSDYWGWQYGAKDIIAYFRKVQDNYDELYMTGDFNGAYIFVPFYTLNRYPKIKAGWLNEYYKPNKKQLFAIKPNELDKKEYPKGFNTIKRLYYPDGSTAFLIGEVDIINNTK